jgi:hypothetical protein
MLRCDTIGQLSVCSGPNEQHVMTERSIAVQNTWYRWMQVDLRQAVPVSSHE